MDNYFSELNAVNVNGKTEKKGKLTYLSWAWAWGEVKKRYPEAAYTIYENEHGWNYHTDGRTCWVKTGVTVQGIEHIEYLPVMDYNNHSLPLEQVTSFDVNKTIQRSLTKALARHGLGLYIYAGEDLPEEEKPAAGVQPPGPACAVCGHEIMPYNDGKRSIAAQEMAARSEEMFGHPMCARCAKAAGKKAADGV